jgi:hypothetical protein
MMTTFTTEDRIIAEKDGSFTANVEPIPFAGLVSLTDRDDEVAMLRKQLQIQQDEIYRLTTVVNKLQEQNKFWADTFDGKGT